MLAMSDAQLRTLAPSIFALSPWERMSHRYRMVPTADVVGMLRERGYCPVRAQQGRTRIPGKGDFTKHMIRFRQERDLHAEQQGEIPELVLTNSHDGTSAYRFMAGVFRVVCLNGLVVQSADFGSISVRHSGGEDFRNRVIDATCQIMEETPAVMSQIAHWKQIDLTPPQQSALAEASMELKPNASIKPEQLLAVRRQEDDRPDLWHTMNRVQENILKGDIRGTSPTGRRTRTRPIKSVGEDLRLNKALWVLASKLAETVG